jgi:DNA-binding FadR family transcriptional regulator
MRHTFKPLSREPVYLKVANAIEADILSGALPEGALLPTEGELCAQFAVTRSSVREGIRLLEQSGLVERGAAKRLVIRSPKMSEIAAAASRGLARGGATFREAWEALQTFYPQAARLAASRLDKATLAKLRGISETLDGQGDADSTLKAAVEFFQHLAAGLDNRIMLAMLQSLNMMIGASLAQVIDETPKARSRIRAAQKEIIAALEARDGDKAAEWMAKHIDDLMRGYKVAKVDFDARIL